jgi:DNA replication protein DnaC
MNNDAIQEELKKVLRHLRLSRILETLSERLALARQQKMPHQDFLMMVLSDESIRRQGQATTMRAQRAHLDPSMQMEVWDETSKIQFDRAMFNEIITTRFMEAHAHVAIVGPVGVGKTFIAHALGHIACRNGFSVLAIRWDHVLKTLKQGRLDNTYETELRKLISVNLLIIDDFGLDAMTATESRDAYDIFTERHRCGSMVITSNRGPDEWIGTFADPIRAQSALDRFCGNVYDLVVEGESYRPRQKPTVPVKSAA